MLEVWSGIHANCVGTIWQPGARFSKKREDLILTDLNQPRAPLEICEDQSHPEVQWKNSNVARLPLNIKYHCVLLFLRQMY